MIAKRRSNCAWRMLVKGIEEENKIHKIIDNHVNVTFNDTRLAYNSK